MSKSNVPEIITKSARSIAAQKRWEKKRMTEEPKMNIKKPNWFKEHSDTIAIVCAIALGVWTMKTEIHSVENRLTKEIYGVRLDLGKEISEVRSEVIKVQTVLILKGIASKEIFAADSSHD